MQDNAVKTKYRAVSNAYVFRTGNTRHSAAKTGKKSLLLLNMENFPCVDDSKGMGAQSTSANGREGRRSACHGQCVDYLNAEAERWRRGPEIFEGLSPVPSRASGILSASALK